jgi:hypothetical protein
VRLSAGVRRSLFPVCVRRILFPVCIRRGGVVQDGGRLREIQRRFMAARRRVGTCGEHGPDRLDRERSHGAFGQGGGFIVAPRAQQFIAGGAYLPEHHTFRKEYRCIVYSDSR